MLADSTLRFRRWHPSVDLCAAAPAQPMSEYDNATRTTQQLVMGPDRFDTHQADVHHYRGSPKAPHLPNALVNR